MKLFYFVTRPLALTKDSETTSLCHLVKIMQTVNYDNVEQ